MRYVILGVGALLAVLSGWVLWVLRRTPPALNGFTQFGQEHRWDRARAYDEWLEQAERRRRYHERDRRG